MRRYFWINVAHFVVLIATLCVGSACRNHNSAGGIPTEAASQNGGSKSNVPGDSQSFTLHDCRAVDFKVVVEGIIRKDADGSRFSGVDVYVIEIQPTRTTSNSNGWYATEPVLNEQVEFCGDDRYQQVRGLRYNTCFEHPTIAGGEYCERFEFDLLIDTRTSELTTYHHRQDIRIAQDPDLVVLEAAKAAQRRYGFNLLNTTSRNWGGLRERWMQDRRGDWYFILPNGKLYKWDQGPRESFPGASRLVEILNADYYSDLALLVNSGKDFTLSVLGQAKRLAGLFKFKAFANDSQNYGGLNERWFKSQDQWFYILPNGRLYSWSSVDGRDLARSHNLQATLDSSYWVDIRKLQVVRQTTDPNAHADLIARTLQETYKFRYVESTFFNWGGKQEKWVRAIGDEWAFITPDGKLFLWDGSDRQDFPRQSALIYTFRSEVYHNPDVLIDLESFPVFRIVDNDRGEFSFKGGWTYFKKGGFNGDLRFANPGEDQNTFAEWTFDELPDGNYRVYATWTPFENRSAQVNFKTIGSEQGFNTNVNQLVAPANDQSIKGNPFELLGNVIVSNGKVKVRVLQSPDGYVIADALALIRQ